MPPGRNRRRKIIWFNPPYSKNVETNIGKKFFSLIDKHFPKGHVLNPIFNRNSVKISYSCLPNIRRIITKHNGKVLRGAEGAPPQCGCEPHSCPVEENCQRAGVVYQATVSYQGDRVDKYVGLTVRPFISRYKEHLRNF